MSFIKWGTRPNTILACLDLIYISACHARGNTNHKIYTHECYIRRMGVSSNLTCQLPVPYFSFSAKPCKYVIFFYEGFKKIIY